MKERNLLWDNYKGVLIFLVVFAHFLYSYSQAHIGTLVNDIVVAIYLFHMPAFIFCSGYLSKSENSKSAKSLTKLLVIYAIFNTLMMVFKYFINGSSINLLVPYNSYWYLLSLICWRILIKYFDGTKYLLPISIIIALLLGFYPEFTNVLSVKRTIAFFPFFIMGYKYTPKMLNDAIKNKTTLKTILSILVAIIFGIILLIIVGKFNFTNILLMSKYTNKLDIFKRLFMFGVSATAIVLLLLVLPNKKLPLITKLGRNSLTIYVIHRFITILFVELLPTKGYSKIYIIYGLIASIITVLILSSDKLNKLINKIVDSITNLILNNKKMKTIILIFFTLLLLINPLKKVYHFLNKETKVNYNISNKLTSEESKLINNSIKISYVGDLILLKDQVTSAYDKETKKYNFDEMFEYTKKYLSNSDFTIGVYEGPSAGDKTSYSTSNYGDGIKLYLNFPDEFAISVKKSGIDFVTTANNHTMDKGLDGALRTLDVLDKVGLEHTGTYRNKEEKDNIYVKEIKGIKVAILAYTSIMNHNKNDDLYKNYPYLISLMPKDTNKYKKELKKQIENDFKKAKSLNPDIIIVMPHMGTQFEHTTNAYQDEWNRYFIELGADVVLGDHAHAVQPIEYIDDAVVVNCPGNFANSYVAKDGDATSIVDIYIDTKTKKVVATSVVPMYTQEVRKNYFRALPIYEIFNNEKLKKEISEYELNRVDEVQKVITKTMLKEEIDINNVEDKYYFINNQYYKKCDINNPYEKYSKKELYKLIEKSNSITFIGDSITEGTKNEFHPYYEPLMNTFSNKKIYNISKGGYTTIKIYNEYKSQIKATKTDTYVIALGTNDVRYRNKKICAMTSEEYINNINKIINLIIKSNSKANIVLISPWTSLSNDTISKLNEKDKLAMMEEYGNALNEYANKNNYMYINANDYITNFFKENNPEKYMVDFIHPNNEKGIKLYSEAVLYSSK